MNEQIPMMNPQQHQHQHQQHHLVNVNPNIGMNQMNQQPQQPQMVPPMNQGYGMWPQPPQFHNPNPNPGTMNPTLSSFKKSLGPRSNWKGKKVNNHNDRRRNSDQMKSLMSGSISGGLGGGVNIIGGTSGGGSGNLNFNSYQPPTLNELQHQNRLKTRKFFPKKKFNKNNMNMNMAGSNHNNFNNGRNAPYAPRNTTSFLIRAKKSGGIASLVSPSPMTPAVLPTPIFSPSREVLVDMAKEEWGVDGYGSMKGLIRLRLPGQEMEPNEDDEEDEGGSSESDVEEHVEVERRLDHDLSRFEMIYNPNNATAGGMDFQSVLENRVDDQDSHIAQLEEENLILKERLFLMERELGDLRRRMQCMERKGNMGGEIIDEEVLENGSENESGSRGEEDGHSVEYNNEDFSEDNTRFCKGKDSEDKNEGICSCEGENNKNNNVLDLVKETENKEDEMVAEKVIETAGKEEKNYDESIDLDKIEGNNKVVKERDDRNRHEEDMEAKCTDNIYSESSEPVVADGDSVEELRD